MLPLVLILVGCAFSFFLTKFSISFFIWDGIDFDPLNEALKKIKLSDKLLFLYSNFISLLGIVMIFPDLSIAWTDINISLNSLLKQPAFILIPPPIVPGIQDKNSNPLRLFFTAKSDKDLSVTALPAIITSSPRSEILLKFFPNFITIPSNKSSDIKVLEPAPRINIFSWLFTIFKNLISSWRLSALKKTFVFPPMLNQFFFLRSYSNLKFSSNSLNKVFSWSNFIILILAVLSSN